MALKSVELKMNSAGLSIRQFIGPYHEFSNQGLPLLICCYWNAPGFNA
jgi:hypothetical protein